MVEQTVTRLSQFRDSSDEVSGMVPDECGQWVSYGSWLKLKTKLEAAESKLEIVHCHLTGYKEIQGAVSLRDALQSILENK